MSAIRLSTNRLDLGSANLTNAEMRGWSETVNALGNATGATTVDLSLGNVVTATTTGATTWTVTNSSSTQASSFSLILTNGGSQTQAWMSGTNWSQGVAPTLNSSGTDVLTFFTTDAGTTWRGAKGGPTPADQSGQKLFVWGSNGSGQHGLGDTIKRSSPVQLTGQWVSISGTDNRSLALRADGSLWSWGDNGTGALGVGDKIPRSSPTQIAGTWVSASAGYSVSLALRADGSLWSWGANNFGQLGLGFAGSFGAGFYRSSPVQISGTWKYITDISNELFALRADGTAWVWGAHYSGQLGLGDIAPRSSPTQLLGNWRTVVSKVPSGGGFFNVGLRTDGTLWTWGKNNAGQLGLLDAVYRSSPVQVGSNLWKTVMKGGPSAMSIRHDGTLWTWGSGGVAGYLGQGDTITRSSPTQVGSGLWKAVSSGYNSRFAMTPDGSLFSWGYDRSTSGYLGLITTTKRSSPTQIPGTWSGGPSSGGFHCFAFKS